MAIFDFMRGGGSRARGAKGYRAYAIGDVHGRLDLLEALLSRIEQDWSERPARKVLLVFLGDLIDRGPQSAEVVERVRTYSAPGVQTLCLLGNHEEVLLRILEGDPAPIRSWLQFGGAQCLESYGADPQHIARASAEEAVGAIRAAIPQDHFEFLQSCADSCRFGDYLFVHAGIRPGVAIDEQVQADMRWIRDPFLLDERDHGCVVVHGHTISADVEERSNRIGIDTGAYRTGVLTAVALEGTERWYLDTKEPRSAA